ncbi:MAG: hypothetical protein ACYSWT_11980 [Planctomycetota bacterium]
MIMRSFRRGVAVSVTLAAAAAATAGPAWVEGGGGDADAGSLPAGAQTTVGEGPLVMIIGNLNGLNAGMQGAGDPDLHDMYFIFIDDPANFCAKTVLPGQAGFDSRLFLFQVVTVGGGGDVVGLGLLGNDNAGGNAGGGCDGGRKLEALAAAGGAVGACCFPDGTCAEVEDVVCVAGGGVFQGPGTTCLGAACDGSILGNAATDGSGVTIEEPGLYLLAITVSPQDPTSDNGIIFFFDEPNEVSGPDGPGGAEPISTWGEGFTACGDPEAGDCCEANGSPSCDDLSCCIEVCLADPFCCIFEWDGECADLAVDLCPSLCGEATGGGGSGRDTDGSYTIYLQGATFSQELTIVGVDIKPGGCPNPFNLRSKGVLPVSVLGTPEFDVSQINISTVRLTGAGDGLGFVAPLEGPPGPHTVIADTGTPFPGTPCDCHDLTGDGIDDLSLKFRRQEIVEELGLGAIPNGELVPLVVGGLLLDGTPFGGVDCVVITGSRAAPPPPPPAAPVKGR